MEINTQITTAFVLNAKKGDNQALAGLYNSYCKAMYNICTKMMGSLVLAEDVLQDCFILAFKNLHQLKEPNQFGGWLKRIVINECLKQSKKTIFWEEWNEEKQEDKVIEEIDWWIDIDMAAIHKEVKNLPNGCRQVFTLFVLENFTHKAIADALNISEGTSKSQYSRAKQLLKERLTKQLQHNG